jgi:hypothetical protein
MDREELEARVARLAEACARYLPSTEVAEMVSLAKAGEPGIALENVSTQLIEHDASPSADVIAEIETPGRAMELDDSVWRVHRP